MKCEVEVGALRQTALKRRRSWILLRPSGDKTREELDKLLHTDDVISMRLLCIEFDSELLFAAACLTWLHAVTRLEYVVDPDLFPH